MRTSQQKAVRSFARRCVLDLILRFGRLAGLGLLFLEQIRRPYRFVRTAEPAHQADRVILRTAAVPGTDLACDQAAVVLTEQLHQMLLCMLHIRMRRIEVQTEAVLQSRLFPDDRAQLHLFKRGLQLALDLFQKQKPESCKPSES